MGFEPALELVADGNYVNSGAGYYLYNAGGDPKVAQKNFEGARILCKKYKQTPDMLQPMRRKPLQKSRTNCQAERKRQKREVRLS